MKRWIIFAVLVGCPDPPTPAEFCLDSCAFYSECDPNLIPLEEMCKTSCTERFADAERIVALCTLASPRHEVDRYRSIPVLESSAIEHGLCQIDLGCPPDEPPDPPPAPEDLPCRNIEMVCLDALMPIDLCHRTLDIDQHRCGRGYQDCVAAMNDITACQTTLNSCYSQAFQSFERCRDA